MTAECQRRIRPVRRRYKRPNTSATACRRLCLPTLLPSRYTHTQSRRYRNIYTIVRPTWVYEVLLLFFMRNLA